MRRKNDVRRDEKKGTTDMSITIILPRITALITMIGRGIGGHPLRGRDAITLHVVEVAVGHQNYVRVLDVTLVLHRPHALRVDTMIGDLARRHLGERMMNEKEVDLLARDEHTTTMLQLDVRISLFQPLVIRLYTYSLFNPLCLCFRSEIVD